MNKAVAVRLVYMCRKRSKEKEKNGLYKNKNCVLVCRQNSAHSRGGQNQHTYDLPHINVENSEPLGYFRSSRSNRESERIV